MILNRDELIKATDLLNLIPARPGVPPSEYICLKEEQNYLNMFLSSDALGQVRVKKSGSWGSKSPQFVDRSVFFPFISVAKNLKANADFEFTALTLKHGRRKVIFSPLQPVSGYGKIDMNGNYAEVTFTSDQKEIVQCAESCATSDPISPHLNCVYVSDKGLVMASNSITMFVGKTKKLSKATPLPLYLLGLLKTDGIQKVYFSPKRVILKFDCGEIMQTVPQQALSQFPAERIMERIEETEKYPDIFEIQAKRLSKVLDRFASYMISVRKQDKNVIIESFKGKENCTISSNVAGVKFQETVKLNAPADDGIKVEWSLDMIQPVFSFLGSKQETIKLRAGKQTPYRITGGDVNLILARKIQ